MHPKAGTTSHGREPALGFDDLPHWRGAICFKYDQYRILPRGATFEAIPGVGCRTLVPDGGCAAACSGGKRAMPVVFPGATLPALLGADRRIVIATAHCTLHPMSTISGETLRNILP
jgi:hypothetical protein